MQSRRHQEYTELSPSERRAPGRIVMKEDQGPYNERHAEAVHKSPHQLRNSSPRTSRGSPERTELYWNSGSIRGERHRPPSISYREIRKRPCHDVDHISGDTEYFGPSRNSDADGGSRLKHVHSHDHATYGVMNDGRDLSTGRATPPRGKSVAIEEGEIPEPFCEICAYGGQSPSHEMDMSHHKDDRFGSHDHLIRSSLTEPHKVREGIIYAREGSQPAHRTAHAREVSNYSHNNGPIRPPGGSLKRKTLDSYGDEEIFPSPRKHPYAISSSEPVDAGRNYGKAHNHLVHHSHSQYRHGGYHIHGDDLEELHFIKQKIADKGPGPRGYPSKNLHAMNPSHAQLHYNLSEIKDHIGDVPVRCCKHAAPQHHVSHSTTWKQASMRKLTVPSCCKESDAPQLHGKLLESRRYIHTEYESIPQHNRTVVRFGPRDDSISRSRTDYSFGTDADPIDLHESYRNEEMPIYGRKARGVTTRLHRVEHEDGMYVSSEQLHNNDYRVEEDFLEDNSSHMRTRNLNRVEYEDFEGSEGLIDEEDVSDIYGSGSYIDEAGMVERTYHRQVHERGLASNGRISVKDRLEYLPEHPIRYGNYRGKGLNVHPISGPKGYQSNHHFARKTGFHNNQKFQKRNDVYFEDSLAHQYDSSIDEEIPEEPELPEDSDEFKQLANEAFLKYTKWINKNSVVQRRYLAQGKAGMLFCIVCGRRFSKEFRTTLSLVKHAFMAQRVQSRANHLGLQRAICVLLGWDTYIPKDMPTASPRVLPEEEAMAQREDLIIWPPVIVIQNISMSTDNPKDQKVIPIESVKAFLRGKGCPDGKMVVCLGKPADQSVMVVKFLGTFSGFGNALKLHQFFVENSRGRADFLKLTSNGGRGRRGTGGSSTGLTGEDEADQILYGYMGISEDLDSMDFKTNMTCEIKSKKEVLDFASNPLQN